jgi:hypothetical protein
MVSKRMLPAEALREPHHAATKLFGEEAEPIGRPEQQPGDSNLEPSVMKPLEEIRKVEYSIP